MATPEAKVKKKIVDKLKAVGAYYFYPVTGGFGRSGVFDIVCCYKGFFIGIEAKAGKGKPTPLQSRNARQAKTTNGIVLLINENNLYEVDKMLEWVDEQIIRLDRPCVWSFDGVEDSYQRGA